MGLLGQIGGIAKEAGRSGLVNGVLGLTGNSSMSGQVQYPEYSYDANGHIKGVNSKYAANISTLYGTSKDTETVTDIFGGYGGLASSHLKRNRTGGVVKPTKYDANKNADATLAKQKKARDDAYNSITENDVKNNVYEKKLNANMKKIPSTYGMLYNNVSVKSNANEKQINGEDKYSDMFTLKLPDWTYADFINERAIWQKGLSSVFDEPGWFYFKIFFHFDTNHGLFGGLLNYKELTMATNSAAKYLYSNIDNHKMIKAKDRINALYKFASILSYINDQAPWYFKEVKNLNDAVSPVVDNFSQERFIEIGVTQDAIDMRLSTLMSLYNYACFDNFYNKEIVPQNLRKFNMSIIVFQTPLRYLHTSFTSNKKIEFMGIDVGAVANEVTGLFAKKKDTKLSTDYKSMNANHKLSNNFGDLMSMKIYTFIGCEFDLKSFSEIIPGQMTNENPFQLGNSSIKISYTKCIEHTMNEFYGMMFGTDGFYFNHYNNFQIDIGGGKSINGIVNDNNSTWKFQQERYQALKDTLEDLTQGGTILGLIDSPKTYKKAIDATEAVMNGLFDGGGMLKNLATNFALGLLGSSQNTNAPQGNIYGDVGIGSAYFKEKVEMLKNGVHEYTTAPYYYDPDTGVRHDLHIKNKVYSAIDFNKGKAQISNFNVSDFLQTNTQKFASKINDKINGFIDQKIFGANTNGFTQNSYRPNPYNIDTAQELDNNRFSGIGKNHLMVDGTESNPKWQYTTKPYNPSFKTPTFENGNT